MSNFRCPGQDMRYWKPEDVSNVRCPYCQKEIEFFKDEPALKCPACGRQVRNPKIDLGCAKWCAFAEQCLGATPDLKQVESLCQRLIARMKDVFGTDQRRIDHALRVLDYAEIIQATEPSDPLTVRAAAVLHDIGILEAERKHGSAAGHFQEIEGPPIARAILEELAVDQERIEHICRIVGSHHSGRDIDTPEFRILWDADWLVNLADERAEKPPAELARLIARIFRTSKGRALAEELFLGKS